MSTFEEEVNQIEENNNYVEEINIDECKDLLQQMATTLQKIANALGVE